MTFSATAYTNTSFTLPNGVTIGTLNDLASNALTITGSSGAVLTLNDGTNSVAPDPADLLYVQTPTLTITGSGTVALGSAGNIDLAAGNTTISEAVTPATS